jgi:hypothetical protein
LADGWRYQIDGEFEYPKGVIGIVVAQKFPEPKLIREKLEEGIARVSPETVWVMRDAERKGHAANFAWQTFKANGIEPFLAPLSPGMKSEGVHIAYDVETRKPSITIGAYDLRAASRDIEMRMTCERIVVFHDKSSNVTAEWIDYCEDRKEHPGDGSHCIAKVYVVERGKVKTKKYRKGKAPH